MAAQTTFGEMLQEARERRGLDLTTAARRLRIRPDILRAIEEGDFERMPPRGYTRNMVNAYARLVGLNPTEMTRRYLDDAYAYQVGRARGDAASTGRDAGGTRRSSSRTRSESRRSQRDDSSRQNAFGRTLYEDRTDAGGRSYAQDRVRTSNHTAMPSTSYTNFYADPTTPKRTSSRLPFIVAAVVVLILLVIVLVLAFGNKGSSVEETPSVPITGLTDTSDSADVSSSDGDNSTDEDVQDTVSAPEMVTFTFAVTSGESAYIEVYEGDSESPSIAKTVEGAYEESYDVTTTLKFVTTAPENVTLTLAGEEVTTDEMTSSKSGVYTYTVDFEAYLEEWEAENGSDA